MCGHALLMLRGHLLTQSHCGVQCIQCILQGEDTHFCVKGVTTCKTRGRFKAHQSAVLHHCNEHEQASMDTQHTVNMHDTVVSTEETILCLTAGLRLIPGKQECSPGHI